MQTRIQEKGVRKRGVGKGKGRSRRKSRKNELSDYVFGSKRGIRRNKICPTLLRLLDLFCDLMEKVMSFMKCLLPLFSSLFSSRWSCCRFTWNIRSFRSFRNFRGESMEAFSITFQTISMKRPDIANERLQKPFFGVWALLGLLLVGGKLLLFLLLPDSGRLLLFLLLISRGLRKLTSVKENQRVHKLLILLDGVTGPLTLIPQVREKNKKILINSLKYPF